MKTFVVSYGFTDFVERDGKILQIDRFVHASNMINQRGVESSLSDAADRGHRAARPGGEALRGGRSVEGLQARVARPPRRRRRSLEAALARSRRIPSSWTPTATATPA